MPMPNDNYQWRPNDRSATTMLRYRVETERWTEGLKSAVSAQTRNDAFAPFVVISHILTLVLCMMIFLFLGIKYVLIFFFGTREKPAPEKPREKIEFTIDEPIDSDDPNADEKRYYRQIAAKIEERRQLNK